MSEPTTFYTPANHKEKCLYSHYILLHCFACGEKGEVNV